MKAMVLRKPRPIEERPLVSTDIPEPVPGPGQIRITIRACGVCHTDLHTVEGDLDLPKLPLVPGHQIVGVVNALGTTVTRFKIGERVGVPWLYRSCGRCSFCAKGVENLCPDAEFTGFHTHGGYTQAITVGERFAYPIPAGFSDFEAAPLLCAGIIGYRALRLSGVESGSRLGLYGFGGSAHVTIQVARHKGCDVYVFTRSESHRKLAEKLGAVWTGRAEETPPQKMNGSIIFAPAGGLVPEALRNLERGGTLALAGVTMSPIPELDYDSLLYWERSIRSVANFTRQDAEELLTTAAEIPVRTTVRLFPLREANQALLELKLSRIDGTAVLVTGEGVKSPDGG